MNDRRDDAGGRGVAMTVPVIDIGGWAAGDPAAREEIAASVDAACRQIGFMQIVGHGVDDAVGPSSPPAIDWFFALSMDEKRSSVAPRPSVNRGYTPPRSERLSHSLGVVSPDDLFEAFNVGSAVSDFPGLELDPEIYAENIWPDVDGAPCSVATSKPGSQPLDRWLDG